MLRRYVASMVLLVLVHTFRRALTAAVDSAKAEKECSFSDVTSSGRVWRKVPESDAQRVTAIVNRSRALELFPKKKKKKRF